MTTHAVTVPIGGEPIETRLAAIETDVLFGDRHHKFIHATRAEMHVKLMSYMDELVTNQSPLDLRIKFKFDDVGEVAEDAGAIAKEAFSIALKYWTSPESGLFEGEDRVLPRDNSELSDRVMAVGYLIAASIAHGGSVPATLHPVLVDFIGVDFPKPAAFDEETLVLPDNAIALLKFYDKELAGAFERELRSEDDCER